MRKSEVTGIGEKFGQSVQERAEQLSEQMNDARSAVREWSKQARRMVQERPGTVLIGAVALGFVLAKVARHA